MTCDGRLFHRREAATGNALSPTVDRRVCRTSRNVDETERSCRLASVGYLLVDVAHHKVWPSEEEQEHDLWIVGTVDRSARGQLADAALHASESRCACSHQMAALFCVK